MSARFHADNAALQRFINAGHGPIVNDLVRRGDLVKTAAQHQIRHGHVYAGLRGSGGGARQGLADTIHGRLDVTNKGAVYSVGSDLAPLAIIHHEGSRPHQIMPRRAVILRFMRPQGGIVFAQRVRHPGTRPNRYLTDNLHLVGK
jgi:hypothetical protein